MKNKNWQFDKHLLKMKIEEYKNMTKRRDLSDIEMCMLEENIFYFSEFLRTMTDSNSSNNELEKSNEHVNLKKAFLNRAKFDFYHINKNIMDDIIWLDEHRVIVGKDERIYSQQQKPTNIINNSLEIYREYAPNFLSKVEFLINHPNSLINFCKDEKIGSQCYFDDVEELPYIHIEEYDSYPFTFIHEIQHGVEILERFNTHNFYKELGPILFELFYIDKMVLKKEKNSPFLYNYRIGQVDELISYLADYFKVLKYLNSCHFSVSYTNLTEILLKNNLINDDLQDIQFILGYETRELLRYVFSFLRGIDLREKIYCDKKSGMEMFEKNLVNRTLYYISSPYKLLSCYESFLKETSVKKLEFTKLKK